MVVVTAAVPVEQREELERLAAERDRTLSYLIRQAVDDYLNGNDEARPLTTKESHE